MFLQYKRVYIYIYYCTLRASSPAYNREIHSWANWDATSYTVSELCLCQTTTPSQLDTVDNLPVRTELLFDIDAVRKQYSWSDVASKFAQKCISRLDAGEEARRSVQYSIVRGRAPGLPWAYGGNSVSVSRYVEPMQSEPPVRRERIYIYNIYIYIQRCLVPAICCDYLICYMGEYIGADIISKYKKLDYEESRILLKIMFFPGNCVVSVY